MAVGRVKELKGKIKGMLSAIENGCVELDVQHVPCRSIRFTIPAEEKAFHYQVPIKTNVLDICVLCVPIIQLLLLAAIKSISLSLTAHTLPLALVTFFFRSTNSHSAHTDVHVRISGWRNQKKRRSK